MMSPVLLHSYLQYGDSQKSGFHVLYQVAPDSAIWYWAKNVLDNYSTSSCCFFFLYSQVELRATVLFYKHCKTLHQEKYVKNDAIAMIDAL